MGFKSREETLAALDALPPVRAAATVLDGITNALSNGGVDDVPTLVVVLDRYDSAAADRVADLLDRHGIVGRPDIDEIEWIVSQPHPFVR